MEDISGGDQEFVQDILETYVDTAGELVESLQAAAVAQAAEQALYAAHTLGGSSRSIGAERLAHLCRELEESAKAGDMGSFSTLAPNAKSEFMVLRSAIRSRQEAA